MNTAHHPWIVEFAILPRYDEELAFSKAKHEFDLALAKDRHHRIDDGADAPARERKSRELPPVGKLTGDDIVLLDSEFGETHSHAVDQHS